jgi:hypothetical protein
MTYDPNLPTVEQIMDGFNRDQRELVDSPFGKMERWCAETMLIGTMKGALSVYDAIRNDAAAYQARADETEARNTLIRHLCAKVDAFESKLDDLVAQVAAEREALRADAEAKEREAAEDPLEDPPDIAEFQARNPPAEIGDNDAETHQPGGELHSVFPKEEPEDLDLEVEDDDDQGDLPEELTKGVAPAPSTYPNFDLPKPPVVSQPVSISLNKE